MDLKLCDTCGGYLEAVPENYEGPAVPACFCNRERHVEEELHRAGAPNDPNALGVTATDGSAVGDQLA